MMCPRSLILLALVAGAQAGCADERGLTSSPESGACASCHPSQHDAWRLSGHATGGSSPVFKAMLPHVEAAWGVGARQRCESCHEPGHAPDGGIGCVSCHAAVGNRETADGQLHVDLTAPIGGPFADASPSEAHGSRRSPFLGAPDLCGTCHEVTGPELFVEPTFAEFHASPAAAAGATCQSCHMPALAPGPAVPGGATRALASHAFVGFDPPWGASESEASAAASATRELLAAALQLDARAVPAESGEGAAFEVSLAHGAAGHAVPTGLGMVRDIHVEVTVTDATGDPLLEESPSSLRLGDQPVDAAGAPVALPTQAHKVEHRRLQPGEVRRVRVAVAGPGSGPFSLQARLLARAVRPDVIAALELEAVAWEIPTHLVHTAEAQAP